MPGEGAPASQLFGQQVPHQAHSFHSCSAPALHLPGQLVFETFSHWLHELLLEPKCTLRTGREVSFYPGLTVNFYMAGASERLQHAARVQHVPCRLMDLMLTEVNTLQEAPGTAENQVAHVHGWWVSLDMFHKK